MTFITLTCKKEPPTVPSPPSGIDTTSHIFTWELDSLGDATVGGSILHDVAIVSDTLALAVGEIYTRDSTGKPDPVAYNLAKWDGKKWILMRILFYTVCGQQSTTPYLSNKLHSCFKFNRYLDYCWGSDYTMEWKFSGRDNVSPCFI
jgi:hypothetical protein